MKTGPLSNRVVSPSDVPTIDNGFESLLHAGSVMIRNGCRLEGACIFHVAMDIACRRWWLVVGNRSEHEFRNPHGIRDFMREAGVLGVARHVRLKRITKKGFTPSVADHVVSELRDTAVQFWDMAEEKKGARDE